jgi:hypothetical protein
LPPKWIAVAFGRDPSVHREPIKKFAPDVFKLVSIDDWTNNDDSQWALLPNWHSAWGSFGDSVRLWMQGKTIRTIAATLLKRDEDDIPAKRNTGADPIPKTLAFTKDVINHRLAILAGGLVAIIESFLPSLSQPEVPLSLSSLPLAIKYGCDSPQTLAWYRFGIRFRRAAHLLAQAFPVDGAIQDDSALRDAVQKLKSGWLADRNQPPVQLMEVHGGVFDALKLIMPLGSS